MSLPAPDKLLQPGCMISDDQSYFLTRAEAEVQLAHRAGDENAARAHYQLAGFYWDRAFNGAVSSDRSPRHAESRPVGASAVAGPALSA